MFCRISDESALIRNSLRNGRVRGKAIGRVRVKQLVTSDTLEQSKFRKLILKTSMVESLLEMLSWLS